MQDVDNRGLMEGLYTISEMAGIFDVSRQTLIYYDKIGLFHPACVNAKGYRFYSPTQIPFMRLICMLRDMGMELDEIARLSSEKDAGLMAKTLRERRDALDEEMAALDAERACVQERLAFYDDMSYWREHEGTPQLKSFPERYVLSEPYPADAARDRSMLHCTLMRAIRSMRQGAGAKPMRGWGTLLRREDFRSEDPIAGAEAFVVISKGAHTARMDRVRVLPEGIYLCISRWGMPYDPKGIRQALGYIDDHGLIPTGDAFDFCYLDATSYTEEHGEDFCCMQIPVRL